MKDPQTPVQPLVMLAPGRSFGTAVCAMLGQHPRLFGLMETHLFARDTLGAWWEDFGTNVHCHGLLRSVAEMTLGEQTPKSINEAKRWLSNRFDQSTAEIFGELTGLVHPLLPVENSPMVAYRPEHMQRVLGFFPDARFLHLTRHPLPYGQSLLRFFEARAPMRHPNQTAALLRNPESMFYGLIDEGSESPTLDPQRAWYIRQAAIAAFTATLAPDKLLRVRVEDLLGAPFSTLQSVAAWLGISCDSVSVEKMLHPESWIFACMGPWNARLGGDAEFLREPAIPAAVWNEHSLQSEVPWFDDGSVFREDVRRLAAEFGYS